MGVRVRLPKTASFHDCHYKLTFAVDGPVCEREMKTCAENNLCSCAEVLTYPHGY